MKVPRGTNSGPPVYRLDLRGWHLLALASGEKTEHRVTVTQDNSVCRPGNFDGLDLESGRVRPGIKVDELRARCTFASGPRAVTLSPIVKPGDLFWERGPHAGSRKRSRYTFEVQSIGCARLQDMTDEDAIDEGANFVNEAARRRGSRPRDLYANAWDLRPRPDAWHANPWVWIYYFNVSGRQVDDYRREVLKLPVDA